MPSLTQPPDRRDEDAAVVRCRSDDSSLVPGCGDEAPDLELAPGEGSTRRLSDFRGSPVILVFHPPYWDPASVEHVEIYNRLIASLPGVAGARLLNIGAEGPWRMLSFPGELLQLPVLADTRSDAAGRYGVRATAAVFVIDADGVIRWKRIVSPGSGLPEPLEIARAISVVARPLVDGEAREPTSGISAVRHQEAELSLACTRRDFVATALGAAFALALAPPEARAQTIASMAARRTGAAGVRAVTLNVNGRDVTLDLEPRVTLLDALREHAALTGTKKGCDHGQCGACTVHIDDRRELSCLTFAVMQEGRRITTIEGLAAGDQLHTVQQAFIAHDGFQCGYCTSGQIMSAAAMLQEPWGPSDDDVREAMSGNICRCGAYPGIVAAIQDVRRTHAVREQ